MYYLGRPRALHSFESTPATDQATENKDKSYHSSITKMSQMAPTPSHFGHNAPGGAHPHYTPTGILSPHHEQIWYLCALGRRSDFCLRNHPSAYGSPNLAPTCHGEEPFPRRVRRRRGHPRISLAASHHPEMASSLRSSP